MAKVDDRQITIPDQHYTCTSCGQCCRELYVHVTPDDLARIEALKWPEGSGPTGRVTTTINGAIYLAHTQTDGAEHCVFLDSATNLCKIHGRFGSEAKPLGCRVYPYNIASTFPEHYSVIARHDCPAVRERGGDPISKDMPAIRHYMSQMRFRGGFDSDDLAGLRREAVDTFLSFLFSEILNNKTLTTRGKLLCAVMATHRAERLGSTFLNDPGVGKKELYGSFFERVREAASVLEPRRMSKVERIRFFAVLVAYLRRDEALVLKGKNARLRRTWQMLGLFFFSGRGRELGPEHPDLPLSRGILFRNPVQSPDTIDWTVYLDLLRIRLKGYQFFATTNFNLNFWDGLRSLFLTFPLVIAAAKWSALARDASQCVITPADVDYAVGAIDHSFGRNAFLNLPTFHILSRQLEEVGPYQRLLYHLMPPSGVAV
jgi:lysine-N-methylase